jgi:hypothetical protein
MGIQRKEGGMTYNRPEVTDLGRAEEAILQSQKPGTTGLDGSFARVPAYDLDD